MYIITYKFKLMCGGKLHFDFEGAVETLGRFYFSQVA